MICNYKLFITGSAAAVANFTATFPELSLIIFCVTSLYEVLLFGWNASSKQKIQTIINDSVKYSLYTTIITKSYLYFTNKDMEDVLVVPDNEDEAGKRLPSNYQGNHNQVKSTTTVFLNAVEKTLEPLCQSLFSLSNKCSMTDVFIKQIDNDAIKTQTEETAKIDNSLLCNLNVPLDAFYYASTIVKTTYNSEVAPLLEKYYNNREQFLEDFKKKNKK
jgi:hypothetical protein